MDDVVRQIDKENSLIEQCTQVFGPERAKQEAQRLILKAETLLKRDSEILSQIAPLVFETELKPYLKMQWNTEKDCPELRRVWL